jgi:hypothetical protein
MQVDAEDVTTLTIPKIVHEQVQVGGDVGEKSATNVNKIETNFDDRKIRKCNSSSNAGKKNTNEDVEPHAQIDRGDV